MFIFLASLDPTDYLQGLEFKLHFDDYGLRLNDARLTLEVHRKYRRSFDREIRDPAFKVMTAVALCQYLYSGVHLALRAHGWLEFYPVPDSNTVAGAYLTDLPIPFDNRQFAQDVGNGLGFVRLASREPALYYALQDLDRAGQAPWDESFYHLQHCLESIKAYFGDWTTMHTTLRTSEQTLKSKVTDFSNAVIRHGGGWKVLEKFNDPKRNIKRKVAHNTTVKTLHRFVEYLTGPSVGHEKIEVEWQHPTN